MITRTASNRSGHPGGGCTREPPHGRILPSMRRATTLLMLASVVLGACTAGGSATIQTSSTSVAPVTTLPPAGSGTTTTGASTDPSTTTTTMPLPDNDCVVATDTSVEGYASACTVLGLTIRAMAETNPDAVDAEADRVYHMLVLRPDLADAIATAGLEGRIIPDGTRITSMAEFADLYDLYPGTDWNRRGRSFPGTDAVPFFAAAEENLLCLDGDFYAGEDIGVRTFAQTIRRFGLDAVDEATSLAIDRAYGRAIAAGLWENTLAEINSDEYWMEGVQSYFDANIEDTADEREPNSSHNAVNTRDELAAYDPPLWTIAQSVFGDTDWRPSCG
jgi:hypothetical protein